MSKLSQEVEHLISMMRMFDNRLGKIENVVFVCDYLVEIGESSGELKILKQSSKSFKVKGCYPFGDGVRIDLRYTSEENYKNHKPLIDKLEKEANEYHCNGVKKK